MLNTQAGDRLPNSAANSLPARNTYKNSATGQHRKIVAKPMILNKLSTLNGCLSAAERRFLPAVRENPTRSAMPEPAARVRGGPTNFACGTLVIAEVCRHVVR